jgi:hypothetical protein
MTFETARRRSRLGQWQCRLARAALEQQFHPIRPNGPGSEASTSSSTEAPGMPRSVGAR